MSIEAVDMNGDGRLDRLVSDRYGERRGVFWLENTGGGEWPEHAVGGSDDEVLFLTRADLDGDGHCFGVIIRLFTAVSTAESAISGRAAGARSRLLRSGWSSEVIRVG